MDLHTKSQKLLEALANSIHDRDPKSLSPFYFSMSEIHVAEEWLMDFVKELKLDCVCLESP